MIKAFFVDFYGTLVHEDGEIIKEITQLIFETGKAESPQEIAGFWWNDFQNMCLNSHGETFETQRALERRSIEHTLNRFRSPAKAEELSDKMFRHWMKPPAFEDAKRFFELSPLPIYIVSNIDTDDVQAAIEYHGFTPAAVFTSEQARAYKPRKELFELALKETELTPNEAVHIGDSLGSDVKGAAGAGIRAVWLNRFGRAVPDGVVSAAGLLDVLGAYRM